jgi:hypothetical protein
MRLNFPIQLKTPQVWQYGRTWYDSGEQELRRRGSIYGFFNNREIFLLPKPYCLAYGAGFFYDSEF